MNATKTSTKIYLDENEMPTSWYNVAADLPEPLAPALHPATGKPLGPQDLAPIFPMSLIQQEVSTERYIEIPEEVQIYRLTGLPSHPGSKAGKAAGHPAKIYYK